MKKKLESELISIAHKVLKLKNREDVVQLHQEAQKLYEKLSVLRFYEENIAVSKSEISENDLEKKLDAMHVTVDSPKAEDIEETVLNETEEIATEEIVTEEIITPILEKEEIIEEKEEQVEIQNTPESLFSPIFELTSEEDEVEIPPVKEDKQVSLEDFLHEEYKEPEFVKVEDVPAEVEKITEIIFEKIEETKIVETEDEIKIEEVTSEYFEKKTEHKHASLNDTLMKGIHIGLNDRIAFVKHLFGGSDEDYNRVLSQINTFNDFDEAQNFIENMVKPDYNNWENKEEYASRFLDVIEKKFN